MGVRFGRRLHPCQYQLHAGIPRSGRRRGVRGLQPARRSTRAFNPLFPEGYFLAGYTGYVNFVHVKPALTLRPVTASNLMAARPHSGGRPRPTRLRLPQLSCRGYGRTARALHRKVTLSFGRTGGSLPITRSAWEPCTTRSAPRFVRREATTPTTLASNSDMRGEALSALGLPLMVAIVPLQRGARRDLADQFSNERGRRCRNAKLMIAIEAIGNTRRACGSGKVGEPWDDLTRRSC